MPKASRDSSLGTFDFDMKTLILMLVVLLSVAVVATLFVFFSHSSGVMMKPSTSTMTEKDLRKSALGPFSTDSNRIIREGDILYIEIRGVPDVR